MPRPTPTETSWIPICASRRDLGEDRLGVRVPDVRHAVGRDDHPVDPALGERLAGEPVAEPEPGLRVGGVLRLEFGDGAPDRGPVACPGRGEDDARFGREGDDRDPVGLAELVDEEAQRILDQLEPVIAGHRTRRVDDEGERCRRALAARDVAGLDPDPEEDLAAVPLTGDEVGGPAVGEDPEDTLLGARVGHVEGVDPLLDANTLRGGEAPALDPCLRERVGGGVDVEGEGRQGVLAGVDVRVDPGSLEEGRVGARLGALGGAGGRVRLAGLLGVGRGGARGGRRSATAEEGVAWPGGSAGFGGGGAGDGGSRRRRGRERPCRAGLVDGEGAAVRCLGGRG